MNSRLSSRHRNRIFVLSIALSLALGIMLSLFPIDGQATHHTPDELDAALATAKSGDVSPGDVEVIARAKAVQAIPALEVQFARTTDLEKKTKIADGLVRLGDTDKIYWNFLMQQATLAVASDLPDPFRDSQGNSTGRQLSPEFNAWVQANDTDASTAIHLALYDLPGKVMLLGETGDPRGIPLLRRALQSHNYQIVAWAAKGLALIQDRQSIPLIIAAVKRAPREDSPLIAESLIYFDDAQAKSAVDAYMPNDKATLAREDRARGRGVFGW